MPILAGRSTVLAITIIVAIAVSVLFLYLRNKPVAVEPLRVNFNEYRSQAHNLYFQYPSFLGTISAKSDQQFYTNEELHFSTSELKISYPRTEGSLTPTGDAGTQNVVFEQVTSKQGSVFGVYIFNAGLNEELFSVVGMGYDNNNPSANVLFLVQGLSSREKADEYFEIIKQIISTLNFQL